VTVACLVALQKNHAFAEESPEEWMPWSYQATLGGAGTLPRLHLLGNHY
jgi:hypothetical protein